MSNICKKCGTEIPEGNKFCPECGKKVKNSTTKSSDGKKKIIPFVIAGGIAIVVLTIIIVVSIVIGSDAKKKLLKELQNQEYSCTYDYENEEYSEYETVCIKDDDDKKRIFGFTESKDVSSISYKEIISDSEIEKLEISISASDYQLNNQQPGIIYAVSQNTTRSKFYPKHCTEDDMEDMNYSCYMSVGEKVRPALKEEYEEYKEYFASGKDKEYLEALKTDELLEDKIGLQEKYERAGERLTQRNKYVKFTEIKEADQFTEDVNDALRYFEETLKDAGISLEEK